MNTSRAESGWLRSWDWIWPSLLLLILGAALRWSTFNLGDSYLRVASARLAYSDVMVFYNPRNPLPYLDRQLEYPPLTGLTIWLTSLLPGGQQGYFLANILLLCGALLATFALLHQSGVAVRLPYFAVAPGLAFYATLNWDALAVGAMIAAISCTRSGRFALAGLSLALGASAKLFPIYILPVLWAHTLVVADGALGPTDWHTLLARLRRAAHRRFLGTFVLTLLVINLPLFLLTLAGWSYFLRFQIGRKRNLDSIWQALPSIPDRAQTLIFASFFLGGVAWLTVRVLRGARWEYAAFLSLLCFLLPTKVYSPQYDLWLLPLLALLVPPLWLWLTFVIADACYYWSVFQVLGRNAGGESMQPALQILNVTIWGREVALLLLFIWAARHLHRTPDPQTIRVDDSGPAPRDSWRQRRIQQARG